MKNTTLSENKEKEGEETICCYLFWILYYIHFSRLINSSTKFNDKLFSAIIFCWIFATHNVTSEQDRTRTNKVFFPTLTQNFICSRNVHTYICCMLLAKKFIVYFVHVPIYTGIFGDKHAENYPTKILLISTYIITTSTPSPTPSLLHINMFNRLLYDDGARKKNTGVQCMNMCMATISKKRYIWRARAHTHTYTRTYTISSGSGTNIHNHINLFSSLFNVIPST